MSGEKVIARSHTLHCLEVLFCSSFVEPNSQFVPQILNIALRIEGDFASRDGSCLHTGYGFWIVSGEEFIARLHTLHCLEVAALRFIE